MDISIETELMRGVQSLDLEKPEEKTGVDISKLLAIIPPASEVLKKEQKTLSEKRIRIKFDKTLVKPVAKISSVIAHELGIKNGDYVEIVVAGKKKTKLIAEVIDSPDVNVVVVYPEELEKQGVADNSIATIRKVLSQ